ncbi:GntR family transcriptional regulator [Streptomyces sp. NPDC005498]|uniref:GntR family transcriptional regulator n=1 Tax=Streptomyces sp. NPDC005498 TaxID=3364717 RepID=UPI0036AAEAB5
MTERQKRPAYRDAADRLRDAIERGDYAPGAQLPTDSAMAEAFETNRSSIGQAVRLLISEGLAVRRGRSTYVARIVHKILRDTTARYVRARREEGAARGAFAAEINRLGMTPASQVTVSRVLPPTHVAELLGVEPGVSAVVSRARRMLADDTPVQIATSYLPVDIAGGTQLEKEDTGPGGTKSRLADLGYAQAQITETIDVRSPEPEEAAALDLTEDQRVYEVTHTARTEEGRAVEVAVHVMPTHLWTLKYTWDLGSTN